MPGISFGAEPNMREVPPGEHALIKLGNFLDWRSDVETEWGQKFSFPITILEHPSYTSIPKKGLKSTWQSKSIAALNLFAWIYQTDGKPRAFDFDVDKEINKVWKLTRTDQGTYLLEQQ